MSDLAKIDAMLASARAEGGAFIDGEMLTAIAQCVADAKRLDWLEDAANEAIEVESFISDNTDDSRVFLEYAWSQRRIAAGNSLRDAIDAAITAGA